MCHRCVKGEGEIEKLQSKVVELRRKVDDTTAAMQELGRENQSLQVCPVCRIDNIIIFKRTQWFECTLLVLDKAVTVSNQEVDG